MRGKNSLGSDARAMPRTLSIFQNRQRRRGGVVLMRYFGHPIDLRGPKGPWPEFTFFSARRDQEPTLQLSTTIGGLFDAARWRHNE